MKTFDDLGSRIAFDFTCGVFVARSPNDIDPRSQEFHKAMMPVRNTTLWFSIQDLLNRSWFERLWIWQEVNLAKDDISLVCGKIEIDFQNFCNAIRYLFRRRSGFTGLDQAHRIASQWSRKESNTFSHLMYNMRHCKCSDERDKVYGLLNLTHEHDRSHILPDYTKSVQEVFQTLLMQQLRDRRSLDLLRLCSLSNASLSLPTWLTWSVLTESPKIKSGTAAAGAKPKARCDGGNVLVATGVCIAVIARAEFGSGFWSTEVPHGIAWEAIGKLLRKAIGSVCIAVARPIIESLCRSVYFRLFSEDHVPPEKNRISFQEAVNSFEECWKSSLDENTKSTPNCDKGDVLTACEMMRGRVIITTANGLLGIGPEGTRFEDKVCVIPGCANPLVLRNQGYQHYQIVGDCCVDGIMAGEALLGPLPSPWKLITKRYPGIKRYRRCFLNQDTRDTQIQDPRLGSLPKKWRIKSHKRQDVRNRYVNDETGEDTSEHPGLRVDALKERGVKFEDFRLV